MIDPNCPPKKTKMEDAPEMPDHKPPTKVLTTRRYDRKLYLAGAGSANAQIMFLATSALEDECAEQKEVAYGVSTATTPRYLRGPAGHILKDILSMVGVDLDCQYYTALVKYLLPKPERAKPKKPDIENCLPILDEEIQRIGPKIIVTFGKPAFEAVVDQKIRFDQIEACWFYSEKYDARVFVMPDVNLPVWKPEYVEIFRINLTELRFMLDELRGVVAEKVKEDTGIITNAQQLEELTQTLIDEQAFTMCPDTEFGGINFIDAKIRALQLSWFRPDGTIAARYIRLMDDQGNYVFDADYGTVGKILSRHLDNPKVKYVGAHISADLPVMHHWFGLQWFNKTLFDTEFAEQCINENADFGLERISLKYTRYGRYDGDLVRWVSENKALVTKETGYLYIPDAILIPYALKDVIVPMLAMPVMKERMRLDDVWNFYTNFVNPMVGNIFTHFAINGLPINRSKIDTLRELYSYARVLLEKDFVEDIVAESKILLIRELMLSAPPEDLLAGQRTYQEILRCMTEEGAGMRALEIFKAFVGPAKLLKALPVMEHFLDAPNFKIASSDHKSRWLFQVRRFRPIKSTNNKEKGRPSMPWDSVERILSKAPHLAHLYKPAADKQSIKMLGDETQDRMLIKLLDVMAVANVCKAFLKPAELDDEGELVKENGLHYWLASDGKIHGMYSLTETFRPRGWQPNPLNWPKFVFAGIKRALALVLKKEKDLGTLPVQFEKYLDVNNIPSLRSVVDVAELPPLPGSQGWCFTETDYVTAELRGLGFQAGDEMLIKLLTEADTQFGIPKDKSQEKLRVRLKYADDCGIPEDHRDPKFLMKAVANNKVLGEFTMDDLKRDEKGELVHPPHDLHWSLVEWVFLAPRELFDSDIQRSGVGKTGNFSSIYGASGKALERKGRAETGKIMEPGTGDKILAALAARQPVATEYLEELAKLPKTAGYYQHESGAKRRFITHGDGVRGLKERDIDTIAGSLGRQARNFPMQHSVAATAIRGGDWLLTHSRASRMRSSPMICLYDSIVTLGPVEERWIAKDLHQKYLTDLNVWHDHGREWNYTIDTDFCQAWSAKPTKEVAKKLNDTEWASDPSVIRAA